MKANWIVVLTRAGFEVASAGVDLKNDGFAQYVGSFSCTDCFLASKLHN
jgi:hypothetical protein